MHAFVLLTMFLTPLSSAVKNCHWGMRNMHRDDGLLAPVHKPVIVRSAMHCVHLCISTQRCDAVQFTTLLCTMYSVEDKSVSGTKQSAVFHVKKVMWPERFVFKQSSPRTIKLVRKMKTPSLSRSLTADVKPPVSTEMASLVVPAPMSTTPYLTLYENSSLPQRNMTQAQCSKHEGFTYMSKVAMCVIYSKSNKAVPWKEARRRCLDKGGDLVGMKSEQEYHQIHKYLKKQGVAGWLSGAIFRSGTWVGLQIHPSGGRWTDNTPLTYRKSLEISVNTTKCVYLKTAFSVMMLGKCRAKMATFLCEVV